MYTTDQVIFTPFVIVLIIACIVFIAGIIYGIINLIKRRTIQKEEHEFIQLEAETARREEAILEKKYLKEREDRRKKLENLGRN